MIPNPYAISFGKIPSLMISRNSQYVDILDNFNSPEPSTQIYMIMGVRGSGKTVFMTELSNRIAEDEKWICIECNPERDILNNLAAKLCSIRGLPEIFRNAKLNLSLPGISLEISGEPPIYDVEVALAGMFKILQKKGFKILITIDETVNSRTMREFAATFQIFIRNDLPVFLLMTGLYKNIDALQNVKSLTFLHRAPKIELKPLNIGAMAGNYKNTFHIDESSALKMSKLTKGYSFAFQVLGYFTWNHDGNYEEALADYKQYLEDYSYEKIWSELSKKDKDVLYAASSTENGRISEIREKLGMKTNDFNPYRKRLIKQGLINGDERGYISFTLPLFETFVRENYYD